MDFAPLSAYGTLQLLYLHVFTPVGLAEEQKEHRDPQETPK